MPLRSSDVQSHPNVSKMFSTSYTGWTLYLEPHFRMVVEIKNCSHVSQSTPHNISVLADTIAHDKPPAAKLYMVI